MSTETRVLAILIFKLLVYCNVQSKILNPVILVPGDGGTQFEAKLNKTTAPHSLCELKTNDYFSLWLNLEELAPIVIDCFTDNMKLVYNRTTHTTSNTPGVDIRISDFGGTSTVEWLDPSHLSVTSYFAPIVEAMVSWGYKRGISVRGVPFDFRKAPNEFKELYQKMKALIEETYRINNNTRVILLGHSMGNPTSLYFYNIMSQAWKDKYIEAHVSLAGVWTGAVKPLRLFASGDSLGVYIVKPIKVRVEQRSMPSSAWLMPSDKAWGPDEILVMQPERNYTVKDYKQFFTDINFMDGWYMRQDTVNLIRDLTPPGVKVHCLHGINVKTPGTLVYDKSTWYDSQPNVINDNGDGTVNIRSLRACLNWQKQQKQPIFHKEFPNIDHMAILKYSGTIQYLKQILVGS
ncbi:phospholipase A2 group XV-like isoform X1 [Saccostrea echinata]|uniref:phospholipase A2 group XV-like isoform X1 n=1 Tax=Saccostrea echinata TaxID=191078 RepID=UPI002A823059|nr:phospholipase A2 group XV-like isoform X1 [Saccostrea echinata]